jgi:hypothetical protein
MGAPLQSFDLRLPAFINLQVIGETEIVNDIQAAVADVSLWFQLNLSPEPIEVRFRQLVSEWQRDTAHLSVVKRKIQHRAYQEIIDMRYAGVPLILKELSERPNHWMPALKAITGTDPSPDNATFDQAVEAWLAWGREKKFLV